jgi:hypothetical protein
MSAKVNVNICLTEINDLICKKKIGKYLICTKQNKPC